MWNVIWIPQTPDGDKTPDFEQDWKEGESEED
jgi:hypothetical protein